MGPSENVPGTFTTHAFAGVDPAEGQVGACTVSSGWTWFGLIQIPTSGTYSGTPPTVVPYTVLANTSSSPRNGTISGNGVSAPVYQNSSSYVFLQCQRPCVLPCPKGDRKSVFGYSHPNYDKLPSARVPAGN